MNSISGKWNIKIDKKDCVMDIIYTESKIVSMEIRCKNDYVKSTFNLLQKRPPIPIVHVPNSKLKMFVRRIVDMSLDGDKLKITIKRWYRYRKKVYYATRVGNANLKV